MGSNRQPRRDPQADPEQRTRRTEALWARPWVVYAKTPLAGPAAVLDYLSRYTHRSAIGNERMLAIRQGRVRFLTRVNRKHEGGKRGSGAGAKGHDDAGCSQARRVTELPGAEFVGRLLQHVLPGGFKRIRHYGLLAPKAKAERLGAARELLAMPKANPAVAEEIRGFMQRVAGIDIERCPHCGQGRLQVIGYCAPQMPRQTAAQVIAGLCRGPP